MKRTISILLAVLTVVSVLAVTGVSASADASGKCGDNVSWSFNSNTGKLTITGSGKMYDYTYESSPWTKELFHYITSVSIGSGVTSIGDYSFWCFFNVESVSIPSTVKTIGQRAFAYCDSLTSIALPDGLTEIGEYAFSGCESLTSVRIPNKVTKIPNGSFNNCYSLSSVQIPDTVTEIGDSAFDDCPFTSITLPSKLTSIGYGALSYCKNLKSISIPAAVTTLPSECFYQCTNLSSVTLNNKLTEIKSYAFAYCSSLKSINIPASVTDVSCSAFIYCDKLTSITVDGSNASFSSVDGLLCNKKGDTLLTFPGGKSGTYTLPGGIKTVDTYAFYYCDQLKTVNLSNVNEVKYFAFYSCNGLTEVTVSAKTTKIDPIAFNRCENFVKFNVDSGSKNYSSVDGVLCDKAGTTLISFPCGKGGDYAIPSSITSIGKNAFYSSLKLRSVFIPSTVTAIDKYAFENCDELQSITLWASVSAVPDSFASRCDKLDFVVIPSNVKSIDRYAFSDCKNLKTVYYEGTEAEWKKITVASDNDPLLAAKLKPNVMRPFYDTFKGKWYSAGVSYCIEKGFMSGTGNNTFAPNGDVTRAMFVTILAKIDGADLSSYTGTSFKDVKTGKWYSKAIEWAYRNNYTSGVGDGYYGVNNPVTREQLAAFLYNYSEKKGYSTSGSTDVSGYPDAGSISKYAKKAVAWAVGNGLISGVKVGDTVYLQPKGTATRAQIALIVMNYYKGFVA